MTAAMSGDAMAASGPLVSLRSASKRFGGVLALDGISHDVAIGAATALIGPNGSGKTTLLNVISGFLPLDCGELWIDGHRMDRPAAHRHARLGIGRTFQEGRVWPNASVAENLLTARRAMDAAPLGWRRPTAVEREAVRRLMREVELDDSAAAKPTGALPLIERRRVELARALALDPKVLLVDEIAAGLNPAESQSIYATLAAARRARPCLAVIAIEHKLDLLLDLAERILFMIEGRIALDATPAAIRADPSLLMAYRDPVRASKGGSKE